MFSNHSLGSHTATSRRWPADPGAPNTTRGLTADMPPTTSKTDQDPEAFSPGQFMWLYWPDRETGATAPGGQPLKPCGAMLLHDQEAIHRAERTEMLAQHRGEVRAAPWPVGEDHSASGLDQAAGGDDLAEPICNPPSVYGRSPAISEETKMTETDLIELSRLFTQWMAKLPANSPMREAAEEIDKRIAHDAAAGLPSSKS